jgi:hypothetical protein
MPIGGSTSYSNEFVYVKGGNYCLAPQTESPKSLTMIITGQIRRNLDGSVQADKREVRLQAFGRFSIMKY